MTNSGRHSSAPEPSSRAQNVRRIATIALAGCVLLAVGWGLAQLVTGGSPKHAGTTTSGSTGSTVAKSGQGTAPSTAQPPLPAPPIGDPADSATGCTAEITAGKALTDAAIPVAAHWGLHTSAQTDYDSHRITVAQAEAIWKATKAHGEADLTKYDGAAKAYAAVKGSCAKSGGSASTACQQRAKAISQVAETSAKVRNDWATHVAAMKTKAHANAVEYDANWRTLVARAPGLIANYNSAVASLASAPDCTLG